MCCGRRLRRIRPGRITKINRSLQEINESIVHCNQLLDSIERTVFPGDWMNIDPIPDEDYIVTWRTVGRLNLTDHFVARYLERIMGVVFDMEKVAQFFSPIEDVNQMMRLRYSTVYRPARYLETSVCTDLSNITDPSLTPEYLSNWFSNHKTLRYNAKQHDFYLMMYMIENCLLSEKQLTEIMELCNDAINDVYVARYVGKPVMITLPEVDWYKVHYAYETGILSSVVKDEIREFVMNPPDNVRIVRKENRVITLLI